MPEESHPIADSGVAPSRVLLGQANDQCDEVGLGSAASSTVPRAIVLGCNQVPIPAQDRVGRDDTGEVVEESPTEGLPLHGEAAPLVVGELESPSRELLSQDAVLLEEVVDHLGLSAIHPAGEHEDEELDRWGEQDHAGASIAPRVEGKGCRSSPDHGCGERVPMSANPNGVSVFGSADGWHTTRPG